VGESLLHLQIDYLLQCQTPTGTFRLSPSSEGINPYFTHLACFALLETGYHGAVQDQLEWYAAHLSEDGYVNDYRWVNGTEQDAGTRDSEDSYHATFFSLLAGYLKILGNQPWVARLPLRHILQRLLDLQQEDGLTWAKRDWKVKYLMDNCEVWRGLTDAAYVFRVLDDSVSAALAQERARRCRIGIERLYSTRTKSFAVSDKQRTVNRHKWYPDVTSQAFPVLFGVLSPRDQRARYLYRWIVQNFPSFHLFQTGDSFPWMIMGKFALQMGDLERAKMMLKAAEKEFIRGPRHQCWLIHEAGFFIRIQLALEKQNRFSSV
jgi:hypothetical protein